MPLLGGGGFWGWTFLHPAGFGPGFASGNGRIEATEIDIAAKLAARIGQVEVDEGDFVQPGEVLVYMDTASLEAQRAQAVAEVRQAETAILTARAVVAQRESEHSSARAVVAQRQAELTVAGQRYRRTRVLAENSAMSRQQLDDASASQLSARATLESARAQVLSARAAVEAARTGVTEKESALAAAKAAVQRLEADIRDSLLKSPVLARVQYRIAEPGEVLGAGGKVLNLIDLTDVYMTFFLPTSEAGQVRLEQEVRLVLDAFPQYVFPARVSYVASVAQFTPKTVETRNEREKLMFRIKARLTPELLRKYWDQVKTGLPGLAYVRLDPAQPWPEALQIRIPQ